MPPFYDKVKVKKALDRLYEEERKLQNHPNFPWIDEIPGYKFVQDEISHLEEVLDDLEN